MWPFKKTEMIKESDALAGRDAEVPVSSAHYVLGSKLKSEFEGFELAMFGMGCFWGAERKFWQSKKVHSTQVGYSAGFTKNPSYQEVCSGNTGHNEVVRVVFDPEIISFKELLQIFWESHNPTQGMRQGNDSGTQYRSGIYFYSENQKFEALNSRESYQKNLTAARFEKITTEVIPAKPFYFAEDYHQQYLAKNPGGYCGLGGTGISCS